LTERLMWGRRYLMVEPRHFDVTYHINPWMRPGVDTEAANAQWKDLVANLEGLGAVVEIGHDEPGLPDMAFAMNAGFVYGTTAVPSRFRHAERQPEEPHWRAMLAGLGLDVVDLPADPTVRFEAGDAFVHDGRLVGGWGFRSDRAAIEALGAMFGLPVVGLEMVDPRFYHLDTCFCPLRPGHALAFLDGFTPQSRERLADAVPGLIVLTEDEATTFVANSVVVGDTFLTISCPARIEAALAELGLTVQTVDVGEFGLSGGSVRCLTLPLDLGPDEGTTS
jgi:N-dimethylarginine dimethylaminohydrolase